MNKTAKELIKLGQEKPELRPHLRPILDELTKTAGDYSDSPITVIEALGWNPNGLTYAQSAISHALWEIDQGNKATLILPDGKGVEKALSTMNSTPFSHFVSSMYQNENALSKPALKLLTEAFRSELEMYAESLQRRKEDLAKIKSFQSKARTGLTKEDAKELRRYMSNGFTDAAEWEEDQYLDPKNAGALRVSLMEEEEDAKRALEDHQIDYRSFAGRDFKGKLHALCLAKTKRAEFEAEIAKHFDSKIKTLQAEIELGIRRGAADLLIDLPSSPLNFSTTQEAKIMVNKSLLYNLRQPEEFYEFFRAI